MDVDRDGVMDPGEAPLAGVPVDLAPVVGPAAKRSGDAPIAVATAAANGITSGRVITAADGTYAFESVVPGPYDVFARLSTAGIQPWWDSDGSGDWNVNVTVPYGTAKADLAAVGASSLTGQVYFAATQQGVSAAQVRCTWSGLDGILGNGDDGVFTIAASADGSFQLANAPYGNYSCAGVDPASGRPSPAITAQVDTPAPSPIRLPIALGATTTTPVTLLPRTGSSSMGMFQLAWSMTIAGLGLQWYVRSRRRVAMVPSEQ